MNDKVKSLFFSQYLGQKVLCGSVLKKAELNSDKFGFLDFADTQYYLLLRDISQLTDEEKINVAKLVCGRHNRHYQPEDITYKISKKRALDIILIVKGGGRYIVQITSDGCAFINYYMGGGGEQHYYCPAQYAVTDYMKSIGTLLSFTYLSESNQPITLTPAEIIALGWAKLKSNEQ